MCVKKAGKRTKQKIPKLEVVKQADLRDTRLRFMEDEGKCPYCQKKVSDEQWFENRVGILLEPAVASSKDVVLVSACPKCKGKTRGYYNYQIYCVLPEDQANIIKEEMKRRNETHQKKSIELIHALPSSKCVSCRFVTSIEITSKQHLRECTEVKAGAILSQCSKYTHH